MDNPASVIGFRPFDHRGEDRPGPAVWDNGEGLRATLGQVGRDRWVLVHHDRPR